MICTKIQIFLVSLSIIIIRNIAYASFCAFISIARKCAESIIVNHARVPQHARLTRRFFFRIPERYTLPLINIKLPVGRDRVTSTRVLQCPAWQLPDEDKHYACIACWSLVVDANTPLRACRPVVVPSCTSHVSPLLPLRLP